MPLIWQRALLAFLIGLTLGWAFHSAHAHDDGRYAANPLKSWFDKLSSQKGLCCSFADGRTIEDADWGTDGDHYWVTIDGKHYTVPPEAVITEPNRAGVAVVWPYSDGEGNVQIRCFMPGSGA